jgi:hypothetical protein
VEAEIGRVQFQTPASGKKLGVVVHACHPSKGGKFEKQEDHPSQPGQKMKPHLQEK